TLSAQIGVAMPRSPGAGIPGRRPSSTALPGPVMRRAERPEIDPEAAELLARARRGGEPLDGALRSRLEASLGTPLDGVRIHRDAEADAAARALGALAFALGDDVFFRTGAYDPHGRDGQRLIAHEVVHTVQARGAPASAGDGGMAAGELQVSQPGDAAEV